MVDFSKHKHGDVVVVHCCDDCARKAGVKPKCPADSGASSWYCEVCGHHGIGSLTDCEIGGWLRLRPLQPNADWNLGLTKDLEVFETKSSHDAAMERHVRTLYPSMSEWEAGDKPRVTGEVLRSIGWTELTPEISEGGITAGRFFLSDSATLNASSQQGGDCRACDSATLNKK